MFCARCGQQIADASETCPLCGREATIKLDPRSSDAQASATAALSGSLAIAIEQPRSIQGRPINQMLKGIRGWLLFFCISTSILTPLAVLTTLAAVTHFSSTVLAIAAITVFGFVAGTMVWMESTWAIPVLRVYLPVLGGYALLHVLLLLAAGFEEVDALNVVAHVRTVVFVVLWAAYFHKSERVRATFGCNL